MSFKEGFRLSFPNQVCAYFDRYIEYMNPVEFSPLEDVYKTVYSSEEWEAMVTLRKSRYKRSVLQASRSFIVLLDENTQLGSYARQKVEFYFDDGKRYPELQIEHKHLPPDVWHMVRQWAGKVIAMTLLRKELRERVHNLLDNQRDRQWVGPVWRLRSQAGTGCNTVGQVIRIWPELLPFLPQNQIQTARNMSMKSRLPPYIYKHGKPEQFTCEHRPYVPNTVRYDEEERKASGELMTDDDWKEARRRFDAIGQILTQVSLMKDVPSVKNYPSVSV